jgi:hypothetical protein
VTYSDIKGSWPGTGNIDGDPCFVTGPEGDYYLSQIAAGQAVDSPCVDAGSRLAASLGMDDCTTRTDGMSDEGTVDMGFHYGSCCLEPGAAADIDGDCDVDFEDYSWFGLGWYYGTPNQIPIGIVTVDGNLSDWNGDVEWRELDEIYWGSPNDVSEGRFALQWDPNANKIYAAVIAYDSNHVFLDEYVHWDASDRLEIYSQGDAEGGTGWVGVYDVAQQYYVAPNTTGGSWATWAFGETLGEDVGLEYAVVVNGDEIVYEVGVRAFDNYGGFSGGDTIVTDLEVGHVVGFDVVVCTRRSNGFGMLSENLMTGKSGDAEQFARYVLVEKIAQADLDGNGVFDFADLDILVDGWLDRYMGTADSPYPHDSAAGMCPTLSLSWWPGRYGVWHDVYFGTDANLVAQADNSSPEFMDTVSDARFDPGALAPWTRYYWRVDEVAGCIAKGDVWSFTTGEEPNCHLVGWWKFDEGSGTTAYDSAGSYDGTIYGAAWTTGQIGGDFDGIDDYVGLPDNDPVWLPQYNFTLSVWVYFERDAGSTTEHLLDLNHANSGDPANELGYALFRGATSGELAFHMTTTTNTDEDLYTDDVLSKGMWYHIVALREGTTQAIYIDGEPNVSRTCSPDPIDFVGGYDDDKVSIGKFSRVGVGSAFELEGRIDDVRIYDRALTAEEIQQLYQE